MFMSTSCSNNNQPVDGITSQVLVMKENVTKENSAQLRKEALESLNAATDSQSDQIKKRLIEAWAAWVPDYEGWLKWSSSLYTPDSKIYAIGKEVQRFADYQASMKGQREACDMEMGPIMQITVQGNTAALIYKMFLTLKSNPNHIMTLIVTEYNTFEMVDGKLMVSRLDLYTGNI